MIGMVRFILSAPIDIAANLFFAICVNWWAPLFADKDGVLPNWLAWAGTFDATLDQGVIEGYFAGPPSYLNRVKWLYRNTAYGFSYYVLGCKWDATEWVVVSSDPEYFYAKASDGKFCIRYAKNGKSFKLGWKAWAQYDWGTGKWHNEKWGPELRIPFVVSIGNPFKR